MFACNREILFFSLLVLDFPFARLSISPPPSRHVTTQRTHVEKHILVIRLIDLQNKILRPREQATIHTLILYKVWCDDVDVAVKQLDN